MSPATPPGGWLTVVTRDDQVPAAGSGPRRRPAELVGDAAPNAGSYWRESGPLVRERVRVNAGGDSGRDDYGLPPVDIEVPDDARELARDVHAYHRELRARRRRHLAKKIYGPLTRDGMVLPLLAGCLALTLLAATLLTVFTARQAAISLRPPRPGTGHAAGSGRPGADLLNATVFAGGTPVILSTLALPGTVLVLALVPPRCRRCLPDLRQLTVQAPPGNIYLVGVRGEQVDGLAHPLGLGAAHALDDTENTLPPPYRVKALTAVVVKNDGTALRVVQDRGHGFQISDDVRALAPASPASLVPATGKPAAPTASSSPAS